MIPGQTHLNTSCMILLSFITGDVKAIKQECMNIVDVRDVARAHVVAAQQADDWKGWGERYVGAYSFARTPNGTTDFCWWETKLVPCIRKWSGSFKNLSCYRKNKSKIYLKRKVAKFPNQ